jgi:glycosyltransferase involved in cell wall biosynthesis
MTLDSPKTKPYDEGCSGCGKTRHGRGSCDDASTRGGRALWRRPLLLSDVKMPWFGLHTGYENLAPHLSRIMDTDRIGESNGLPSKITGRTASLLMGHRPNNSALSGGRVRAALRMILTGRPLHILYGEAHLPEWGDFPVRLMERTLLTLHQPFRRWDHDSLGSLRNFRHAICLSSAETALFRDRMAPGARVRFIPHGTDTRFFRPGRPDDTPRLLYSGVHLRNVAMLARIATSLRTRHPHVVIDALVPRARRKGPHFEFLSELPNIRWHEGLDDGSLLSLYRRSYLLLLPMNESSANTAVVEALSCGLPIVTTDVGGIRDYGGGSLYPVVANDDDEAMLALIDRYLGSRDFRNFAGDAAREFAERELSWERIAAEHAAFYEEIWA